MKIILPETPGIPAALEQRILNHAMETARSARRRKLWFLRVWPATAAACAMIAVAIFLYSEHTSSKRVSTKNRELLAMNDWSNIEQETYQISFELFSNARALEEYAVNSALGGKNL